MEERVALLVAPVRMHDTTDYLAAFRLVSERHPERRIVADEDLWSTAKECQKTYKKWLDFYEVSNFYILTSHDGTVGNSIFNMWCYLCQHQESRTTALIPAGYKGFEEIADCELSKITKGSARYAVPVLGTTSSTST